jgi:Helicase associated domain
LHNLSGNLREKGHLSTMETNAITTTATATAVIADPDPNPVREGTVYDLKWEVAYQRLRAFHHRHGHTHISYRDKKYPTLGRWGA